MAIIEVIQHIAQYGQPPASGIRLFSAGYEEVFNLLEENILDNLVIERGNGVEKYIVGNYGTGKTHFLRQVQEIAMEKGLFTSEVHLNRDVNHLNSLMIYREFAETINHRDQESRGIRHLIRLCVKKMEEDAERVIVNGNIEELLLERVNNIKNNVDLGDGRYKKVLCIAIEASILDQDDRFSNACSWLEGNFADTRISRMLNIARVESRELNIFCQKAILSLCKFLKLCGFAGTVICYDEAELTMNLKQRDFNKILDALRQLLDRTVTEEGVGLLRLYAFTPDVIERMMLYPALQQRISDPDHNRGFTEGNPLSPQINLEKPFDTIQRTQDNFRDIGYKMVDLFCNEYKDKMDINCNDVREIVDTCIREFANPTITARREYMRKLCSRLYEVYRTHVLKEAVPIHIEHDNQEDEV